MVSNSSDERELNFRCQILIEMTKECVENPTKANEDLFRWAYHEIWKLKLFPKFLCSKKAYDYFYKETGLDIRNYGWDDQVKDKNGKRIYVREKCMHEHIIPSSMIGKLLKKKFLEGTLTIQKVKEIILTQRICWILRIEDDVLKSLGYMFNRPNPILAYQQAGIDIIDTNLEELKLLFDKLDLATLFIQKKTKVQNDDKTNNGIRDFFVELKQYFVDNPIILNNQQVELKTYGSERYATIFRENGLWVNMRINRDNKLMEIGIYLEGGLKAKRNFDKFHQYKTKIESYMGPLVWQRDCYFKVGSGSSRISRYGPFAKPEQIPNDTREQFMKNIKINPYTFDVDDIKKVANELVKYYKVFVLDELNLFH